MFFFYFSHVLPLRLEHVRNAGSERTMFLIVSANSHKKTVLANYYADTTVKHTQTVPLTSRVQETKRSDVRCGVKPPTCPLC